MVQSSNKSMTWAFIIGILILLGFILKMTEEKKVYNGKEFVPQSQYEKNKSIECIGNQNCIDKVRLNFTSSGKQILNESYLGNGKFKITGLDPIRGITFNSTISTDCKCNLTDVKISDIQ